jgi:dienelactone hydrolase
MKTLLISGVVIAQAAIWGLYCFGGSLHAPSRTKIQLLAIVLCLLVCCGFLIALGGYVETRLGLWLTLEKELERGYRPPPEPFIASGDPGLVRWAHAQVPQLPRPNLADSRAFQFWQTSLRGLLRRDLFKLPETTLPQSISYQVMSEKIVESGIKRTFLTYESFDGTRIPVYLLVPPLPGPRPVVIVLHGHLLRDDDEGISQTAGMVDSYQNRVGLELAKAGYVTLMLEFRGFGYLGTRIGTEHEQIAYNALLSGTFYKAILAKDIHYAVDLLQMMEIVNPQRIGITGVSFGGEMAVTYSALDERIKVIVFQGFGGQVGPQNAAFGTGVERPHYCHLIPSHNAYLFQEDLFLLLAPRPLLGIRGNEDGAWDPHFRETLEQAYSRFGVVPSFPLETVPGGHEYFVSPAIQFFQRHL